MATTPRATTEQWMDALQQTLCQRLRPGNAIAACVGIVLVAPRRTCSEPGPVTPEDAMGNTGKTDVARARFTGGVL